MIVRMKKHVADDGIHNQRVNVEGKRHLSQLKLCKTGVCICSVVIEKRGLVLIRCGLILPPNR